MKYYFLHVFTAVDQLANALAGGYPDETISARCYREKRWHLVRLINFIMRDKNHCRHAYEYEIDLPKSYQNQKVDDR